MGKITNLYQYVNNNLKAVYFQCIRISVPNWRQFKLF